VKSPSVRVTVNGVEPIPFGRTSTVVALDVSDESWNSVPELIDLV
jgi:hypothetical protein